MLTIFDTGVQRASWFDTLDQVFAQMRADLLLGGRKTRIRYEIEAI